MSESSTAAKEGRLSRLLEFWETPVLLVAFVALVALVSSSSAEVSQTATTALVTLVVIVGLSIFIGNSGVLSFGHIGFMAIGAYASAILTIPSAQKGFLLPGLPGWLVSLEMATVPAVLVSGALCAVFALLVGIPLMRLGGVAASIATLSLLIIVNIVIGNWDSVTRGNSTMVGMPIDTTLWVAVAWVAVAILVAYLFQQSRFGLRLRTTREEAVAAVSVGVRPAAERLRAWVLSAFVTGVGGALYGHLLGAFSPKDFYFTLTFTTIAVLVIGGINSLSGAVFGSIAVSALSELLRRIQAGGIDIGGVNLARPGMQQVVLALLMLAVLLLRPSGLFAGSELRIPRRRPRRDGGDDRDAGAAPSVQGQVAS